jgi:hypothetical protein
MSTLEDREHDARQDRIADDQAERDAAELRALHLGFEVGDRVTVGKGRTVWTIDRFWGERDELASLEPVDGYSGTSVLVSRLKAAD